MSVVSVAQPSTISSDAAPRAPQLSSPGDEQIAARILADVRAYVPTLRERARQTEVLRRVPDETIRELDELGVFRMCVPVEYGGYALTPVQQFDIVAEIARGCGSTGWVVWVTTTSQQWVSFFDPRFQAELFGMGWVGPLNSGVITAWGPGFARRVEGGYMLKGRWPFNSACHHTPFHHLGASCEGETDRGPILLQVPHEQLQILDDWKVMGQRGSGSNTVVIEDEVFVPEYRVRPIGDIFAAKRLAPAPEGVLYQVNLIQHTASLMAAIAVGLARAAVELFQEKIHRRGISNSGYSKQSEAPVTHLQLGELHCQLRTVEMLARGNVEKVQALAATGQSVDELEIARTKLESAHAIKLASEITALTLRAGGASSIMDGNPFERLFRDSRVVTLHAHTQIETCQEDYGRAFAKANAPAAATPQ
ncbi:acyl-CoA dehydrogenase family protein [Paraburkholderia sp. J63]|uniref:acyl-CoA dehydrogenase family protein n=1 Tax=Paraburkholderia sp. J63 TaxID=2805434 RepID=UPI002ABDDFC0|nr:acyl-CoA dehydrogenase family protein [Paraburkholderia sp. J63]